MSKFKNKPNPDNRSDNVEKLQTLIRNTQENKHKAEIALDFSEPHQEKEIKEKIKRREKAIQGFREEIKDEAHKGK